MVKYFDYVPEKAEEEYAVLIGRLEAFAAYVDKESYIDRELIASMLGFELHTKRIGINFKIPEKKEMEVKE